MKYKAETVAMHVVTLPHMYCKYFISGDCVMNSSSSMQCV